MVVAHHSAVSYQLSNTFDKAFLRGTSMLWVGVDLFFVLSGFLITNILLETRDSSQYFKAFYGRRFLRIFPLYYGFLIVLYVLLPLLGTPLTLGLKTVEPWEWSYTANIYAGFHQGPDLNINHFWTLSIEEQFYLIWPLVVLLIKKERSLAIGVGITILLLPLLRGLFLISGFSSDFIYTFTLCHMDGLLMGAFLSLLYRSPAFTTLTARHSSLKTLDRILIGIISFLFLVYCGFVGNHEFVFSFSEWSKFMQCISIGLLSLPFAYIVFRSICSDNNIFQRITNVGFMRSAGKYSYALYVLHVPVCYWVGAHFPVPAAIQSLPQGWSFVHSIYIISVDFILSLLSAILSWHVYEKHFLKLKKYFPYHTTKSEPKNQNTVIATGLAET